MLLLFFRYFVMESSFPITGKRFYDITHFKSIKIRTTRFGGIYLYHPPSNPEVGGSGGELGDFFNQEKQRWV